jgi:hypothetical protein
MQDGHGKQIQAVNGDLPNVVRCYAAASNQGELFGLSRRRDGRTFPDTVLRRSVTRRRPAP